MKFMTTMCSMWDSMWLVAQDFKISRDFFVTETDDKIEL